MSAKTFAGIMVSVLFIGCATTAFKPITNEEVLSAPGMTRAQIFDKARQWFSTNFVSGKDVVDLSDKASGTIIGKGYASMGGMIVKELIEFQMRVDTKDGRYKVSTTLVRHVNEDTSSIYTASYVTKTRIASGNKKIKDLIESLHEHIIKKEKSW